MNSNLRTADSIESNHGGGHHGNTTNYLNNDAYSTSINSVGSSSSLEQSWDGKNNTDSRLMSQEGVFQLTKDLRRFSEALTALKTVFLEERDSSDKSMRVLAHERLGELLNVLKLVVDKYAELNSADILAMAGTLIKHVKDFNYEEDRSDVSPDIFRSINNLAMAFCSSVSECLMGDININPTLSLSTSQSFDNLEAANQAYSAPEVLPEVTAPTPIAALPTANVTSPVLENVDHTLQNIEGGLEMAFDRAKILSKYLQELITYVKKKANLETEHAKALLKLSQATKPALSEQSFLPFQSLYCTALDHDREYASNCQTMYINSLLQQKFIEPLQAKKNEHDKKRKAIRDSWSREKRKLEEAITNMKKAKQAYNSRVQEYQKAKEAAIRAEGEQSLQTLPKYGGVTGSSSISSVLHNAAAGTTKMERKKKVEEDTNAKAQQAELNYKAFVHEANKRQHDLEKNKVVYLQQLRELITQCDQRAKSVTISYFQLHHHLYSPLPVQFQAMCEDARRYEPGFQYSDYIRNLPVQPHVNRSEFEFERYAQDGSPYLVQTGAKLAESEESPYQGRGRRSKAGISDTESSSSRSLDDISPSASPGDLTRSLGTAPQLRRHSTEGSVSSEDVLDDKDNTGGALALPTGGNLEPTPNSSPLPKRNQMSKQAVKMVANVRGAFKMPKKQPKASVFGVEFSIAAQDAVDGIPYVVKRCIAEIDNRALCIKGIYRINGVKNRVEKICAQFESNPMNIEISQQSPHDVSSVLKCFLRQLPEPLLQFNTYSQFLQIAKDYQQLIAETNEAAKRAQEEGRPPPPPPTRDVLDALVDRIRQTVDKLPLPNRNTLQYIISHLTRVAAHSKDNKMTASNLAIVFGPTLMRQRLEDGNESLIMLIDMPFQSRIVEMLIDHKDYIFGTHSHQAGNIFPFPGFQQAPSSYAPENVDDNALTPDSAISESEDLAASVSDLSVSDPNAARSSDILLDFDDGAAAGGENYGASTIDNFPINTPANAGAFNESRTLLSNSASLIDTGALLDLQAPSTNPFMSSFLSTENPRPNSLGFATADEVKPPDRSLPLLDFSLFETPQQEVSTPGGWTVDGPPLPVKQPPPKPPKHAPETPQAPDPGPVAPKRSAKNRRARKSIDEEDDAAHSRAGAKLVNLVGRRLSATSFKLSGKRPSLTKTPSVDEEPSPPHFSPRKTQEPQTPTEGHGRKLPTLPPHVMAPGNPSTLAGRTPPQLPLGNNAAVRNKSSTLPLSLRNGEQVPHQPAAKREILLADLATDEKEVSFC